MGLTPEGEDLTALTAHLRPLAHQASEGLRQASEDLHRSADRAGDALGERLAIPWSVVLHRILVVLRFARHVRRLMSSGPATWSRNRWLLGVTLVAAVTALAATAIAAVLRSRRAGSPEAAAVTAPVVIPVSLTADEDGAADEPAEEALRSA
jgi:hypothetical protein